jgi:hypothetical protein
MSLESSYDPDIYVSEKPVSIARNVEMESNIKANPRLAVLKKAVELTVRDFGGEMGTQVRDADGKTRECMLSIKTPEFPNGLGIDIDRGRIKYLYDSSGNGMEWGKRLGNAVNQNYMAIVAMKFQEERGYRVTVEKKTINKQSYLYIGGKR